MWKFFRHKKRNITSSDSNVTYLAEFKKSRKRRGKSNVQTVKKASSDLKEPSPYKKGFHELIYNTLSRK